MWVNIKTQQIKANQKDRIVLLMNLAGSFRIFFSVVCLCAESFVPGGAESEGTDTEKEREKKIKKYIRETLNNKIGKDDFEF